MPCPTQIRPLLTSQDVTISGIIAGEYVPDTSNHGKVVYKRKERLERRSMWTYTECFPFKKDK